MHLDASIPVEIGPAPATRGAASNKLPHAQAPGTHRSSTRKVSRKVLRILWRATLIAVVSPVILAKDCPAPRSLLAPLWLQD